MPGTISHAGEIVKKTEEDCPHVVWAFIPVGGNYGIDGHYGSEWARLSDRDNWSEAHGIDWVDVDTSFSQSGSSQAVSGRNWPWKTRRRMYLEVRVTSFPGRRKSKGWKVVTSWV